VLTLVVFFFVVFKLPAAARRVKQNRVQVGSTIAGFLHDFREFFRGEKYLTRWIAVMLVRNFSMRIAMPFVPLWMVDVKGADPYILGLVGTIGTIMAVFLQIPVGRLADRIGRKKTYLLLRPMIYLGTFLLILAPRPEYLLLVGVLGAYGIGGGGGGGGIGGVSFTPYITMHWEIVPPEKIGRWYGIQGVLSIISFPAALLGGFLWQQGLMMEVLLLPLALEIFIMLPLFLTVPDTLQRSKSADE
jgi:MFS family permease